MEDSHTQTHLKRTYILHYLNYLNCLKTTTTDLSMTLDPFHLKTTSCSIFQLRFSPLAKPVGLGGRGLQTLQLLPSVLQR